MRVNQIADALAGREKGQIFSLTIGRAAHVKVGCPLSIDKITNLQGQMCAYSARTPVKVALANAQRGEPELPKHILESFYVGGVRFWRGKNGSVYLPVVLFGSNLRVQWFANGKPVQKDSVAQYLLADELKTRKDSDNEEGKVPFIAVNVDHITSIR